MEYTPEGHRLTRSFSGILDDFESYMFGHGGPQGDPEIGLAEFLVKIREYPVVLDAHLKTFEDAVRSEESTLAARKKEVKQAEFLHEEFVTRLAVRASEGDELTARNNLVRSDLEILEPERERLMDEVQGLKAASANLNPEVNKLRIELKETSSELCDKQSQLEDLEQDIAALIAGRAELHTERSTIENAREDVQMELDGARNELNTLRPVHESLCRSLIETQSQSVTAVTQLKTLTDAIKLLEPRHEELGTIVKSSERQISLLEQKREILDGAVNVRRDECKRLEDDCQPLREEKAYLIESVRILRHENSSLTREKSLPSEEESGVKLVRSLSGREADILYSTHETAKAELERTIVDLESKRKEVRDLVHQKAELAKQKMVLGNEIREMEQRCDMLRNKIA